MAYDPGALEAALAAAVGEDSPLIAELRGAFLSSADAHLAALRNTKDAGDWSSRAQRLHGLAASFGALRVMDAAQAAGSVPAGNARALARVAASIDALRDGLA